MSINGIECAFIARVGTEPEMKVSQAGKPWASFSACVGDKDDEQQWLRIAIFGDKATSISVAKGDRIYVEGRLKLENWTSKIGEAKSGMKVAAWKVERLGEIGKNRSQGPKALPENERPAPSSARPPQRDWQKPAAADADGMIPF
jgi:single-strand DNA-binding protein